MPPYVQVAVDGYVVKLDKEIVDIKMFIRGAINDCMDGDDGLTFTGSGEYDERIVNKMEFTVLEAKVAIVDTIDEGIVFKKTVKVLFPEKREPITIILDAGHYTKGPKALRELMKKKGAKSYDKFKRKSK